MTTITHVVRCALPTRPPCKPGGSVFSYISVFLVCLNESSNQSYLIDARMTIDGEMQRVVLAITECELARVILFVNVVREWIKVLTNCYRCVVSCVWKIKALFGSRVAWLHSLVQFACYYYSISNNQYLYLFLEIIEQWPEPLVWSIWRQCIRRFQIRQVSFILFVCISFRFFAHLSNNFRSFKIHSRTSHSNWLRIGNK